MQEEIKVESSYGVEYTFIKHLPIIGIERVYDFTLGILFSFMADIVYYVIISCFYIEFYTLLQ